MLRLYDTRRRAIHQFKPRADPVTIYVCGVTPYDTTHLGHARTFLIFDVLVRLLEARGQTVKYVQNVTDIDESILLRANRDGIDWRELGKREEKAFLKDMRALNWRKPDVIPHATRELVGMRDMIRTLMRKDYAYSVDGSVYFDISCRDQYGELSRFSPVKMRAIHSAQDDSALDDPRRRNALDFALWRAVPSGPTWPSPWGAGRPGWHLECSAMALRYLGPKIDLHGGGSDLMYPHHENEIAQSEAATGERPVVKTWMHPAAVRLEGDKMSKSKGNMVFVRDALKRVSAPGLRLYLLDGHYRKPFDFDEAKLLKAEARAARLSSSLGRGAKTEIGRDKASLEVMRALDDDLDTRRAIRTLERAARQDPDKETRASLRAIARVLGIV